LIVTDRTREIGIEYSGDQYCREVIRFLKQHPRTRFSRLAIVHALSSYKWCIEQALNRLTAEGVVQRYSENGISLYSLETGR
jgi:N-glycosylase/DNA lyase